jgi:hypothetical protein
LMIFNDLMIWWLDDMIWWWWVFISINNWDFDGVWWGFDGVLMGIWWGFDGDRWWYSLDCNDLAATSLEWWLVRYG